MVYKWDIYERERETGEYGYEQLREDGGWLTRV